MDGIHYMRNVMLLQLKPPSRMENGREREGKPKKIKMPGKVLMTHTLTHKSALPHGSGTSQVPVFRKRWKMFDTRMGTPSALSTIPQGFLCHPRRRPPSERFSLCHTAAGSEAPADRHVWSFHLLTALQAAPQLGIACVCGPSHRHVELHSGE